MPHHIVTTNNNLLTRLPKLIWEQASLQGADFFMGENILWHMAESATDKPIDPVVYKCAVTLYALSPSASYS